MERYLYIMLNIVTLIFPLLWSFEPQIAYAKKWHALFPALLATASVFLVWDEFFTAMGIWGFNDNYLIGIYVMSLPIEEWMFFLIVPFSSLFIYEVLNYYLSKDYLKPYTKALTLSLLGTFLLAGIYNLDKLYTSWVFFFAFGILALHYYLFSGRVLGRFYIFYLVHLIPFLLFNGTLTGSFTADPVVFYDDMQNLGIRIFSIPLEDFIYSMGLMLTNITLFEMLLKRKTISASSGY